MNGGKKNAMTEAERMLLMQQDELRKLRSSAEAFKPSTTPQLPSAPALPSTAAPTTPSLQAAKQSEEVAEQEQSTVSIAKGGVLLQRANDAEASVAAGTPTESGEGGSLGGLLNIVGVLAAGVLGGLLYQSNQGKKRVKEDMEGQIADKQKVCYAVLTQVYEFLFIFRLQAPLLRAESSSIFASRAHALQHGAADTIQDACRRQTK